MGRSVEDQEGVGGLRRSLRARSDRAPRFLATAVGYAKSLKSLSFSGADQNPLVLTKKNYTKIITIILVKLENSLLHCVQHCVHTIEVDARFQLNLIRQHEVSCLTTSHPKLILNLPDLLCKLRAGKSGAWPVASMPSRGDFSPSGDGAAHLAATPACRAVETSFQAALPSWCRLR